VGTIVAETDVRVIAAADGFPCRSCHLRRSSIISAWGGSRHNSGGNPALGGTHMRKLWRTRPIASAVVIQILQTIFVLSAAAGLAWLFPQLPGYSLDGPSQSFVLVLLSAGVLLAVVAGIRWWSPAGFTRPSRWRYLRLYWLPTLLLLVPFVAGVRPVPPTALGLLLVAYVATGVFEEGLWRGVMLGLLRPECGRRC
jgi:membrane protease YdiL (CAAX protease family)